MNHQQNRLQDVSVEYALRIFDHSRIPVLAKTLNFIAIAAYIADAAFLIAFMLMGDIVNLSMCAIFIILIVAAQIIIHYLFYKDVKKLRKQVVEGNFYITRNRLLSMKPLFIRERYTKRQKILSYILFPFTSDLKIEGTNSDKFIATLDDHSEMQIWDSAAEQAHFASEIDRLYVGEKDEYCGYAIDGKEPSNKLIRCKDESYVENLAFEYIEAD